MTTPFLLLRLEAPLMAFGGAMVDATGRTRTFPGQAQIVGLLGNALGWRHQDSAALEALQARVRMAATLARPGERLRDYQTVDLGLPHLQGTGWTTRGAAETRGGASGEATHIRTRWYLADACVLVALTLAPVEPAPDLEALEAALRHPARPLFIGRKACLPTAPVALGRIDAPHARAALHAALGATLAEARLACCPDAPAVEMDERLVDADAPPPTELDRLVDRRDWRNQMHTGTRAVHRFALAPMTEAAP